MADVARRRTQTADRLGNRAVGHRSGLSSHANRRQGNSRQQPTADSDEIRYGMDILVQPPATAVLGHPLNPPLTIRLRALNGDLNDAIADSTSLVAVATLTGQNGEAIDLSGILAGRPFDSIHPFDDEEDADNLPFTLSSPDPRGVGYVSFPNLVIRREGTYRIRITLIRIPRSSAGDPPASPMSAGSSVQVIESNPVTVQGNGSSAAPMALQQGKQMVAIY